MMSSLRVCSLARNHSQCRLQLQRLLLSQAQRLPTLDKGHNHRIKCLEKKNFIWKSVRILSTNSAWSKKSDLNEPPPEEQPKGTGSTVLQRVQNAVTPYYQLMRLDRPIGTLLCFWPGACSVALSAAPGCWPDPKILAIFGLGAFIMRGAGCTINDMWDKDLDSKVERTKNRPIASGQISPFNATVFLSSQLSLALLTLLELNHETILLGASCLGLIIAYPLMKRVTYWPQFVLGLAFNWSALMGWCATHGYVNWSVCLPLYLSCVCWTLVYDTIYAHQDKVDDLKAGIKSTALRFGQNTKLWLSGFSVAMMSGLAATGVACDQTWPYYTALGLVGGHLVHQIYTLKIDDPADCGKKFVANNQIGLILFLGIVLSTLLRSGQNEATTTDQTQDRTAATHLPQPAGILSSSL